MSVAEGIYLTAAPGTLHAIARDADGVGIQITFRVYSGASALWVEKVSLDRQENAAVFTIPRQTAPGDSLHIIVKAHACSHHRLVHYQQVIVTVK